MSDESNTPELDSKDQITDSAGNKRNSQKSNKLIEERKSVEDSEGEADP